MILLRADDACSPCVDYVMRLFARTHGYSLSTATAADAVSALARIPAPRIVLIYDDIEAAMGTLRSIEGRFDCAVFVDRGSFFGSSFLEAPDLPESPPTLAGTASREGFRAACHHLRPKVVRVHFDLIAAAFWFLSRYEEYVVSTPDDHGRFLCAHSIAPTRALRPAFG